MVIRKICKAFRLSTAVAVLALCMAANASAVGTGQTTASQLNIRTEPFGPVITTVPEGTKLAILASSDGWAQVSVNGMLGYASMDYIVDAADSDFSVGSGMISADDVNFRSAPSTSAAVIGRFQSGTSVVVSGISDGWFKVSYNGKTGFVHPDYLAMTGETVPLTALPSIINTSISPTRQAVLEFAARYLGTPYKYGGASPDGFDCSGFTYFVYQNVVRDIPRTATDQRNSAQELTMDELLPGDLVFFRNSGSGSGVGHAGIYVGEGQFIHSPNSGDYVSYDTLWSGSYNKNFICGGRFLND